MTWLAPPRPPTADEDASSAGGSRPGRTGLMPSWLNRRTCPMTHAVVPRPSSGREGADVPSPARRPRPRRRVVLVVLAAVVFVGALLNPDLGAFGLIPFGL